MKRLFSKGGVLSVIFLVYAQSALAYIDVGTGSMLLGSVGPIIGLILAAIGAFFMKRFIKPIKGFFHNHKVLSTMIIIAIVSILVLLLFTLF